MKSHINIKDQANINKLILLIKNKNNSKIIPEKISISNAIVNFMNRANKNKNISGKMMNYLLGKINLIDKLSSENDKWEKLDELDNFTKLYLGTNDNKYKR